MNKEILNQFIDLLSKYPMQVNKLIYANKVDSYDNYNYQSYSIEKMSEFIFELLENKLCFVRYFDEKLEKEIDISQKSMDYYRQHQSFDFGRYDSIGLTDKGGEYWEQLFHPNWDYFIDASGGHYNIDNMIGMEVVHLNSTKKQLLDEICQPLPHLQIEINEYNERQTPTMHTYYWKTMSNTKFYCYTIVANSDDDKILLENTFNDVIKYDEPLYNRPKDN